jgi:hypothetical protein
MNNNHGRGKSELEKDNLYLSAKNLWEEYAVLLRDMNFTFYLNRKQYQFLTDLLIDKMEYDVNTIFLAIELTNMLGQWKESGKSKDDTTLQGYPSDATEVTYMYHLISKHKVKGLTKDSYTFSEVLMRIGTISKLFNYYDSYAKSLSTDIQNWVSSFEEGVSVDKIEKKRKNKKEETIEATVIEPTSSN